MMRAMYAAISGLEVHQTMLDVTANNLANENTIGYKAQRTEFVDELYQVMSVGSGPNTSNAGTNPEEIGLGAVVGSIDNVMTIGGTQSTGNPTDVAIQGAGFLRVAFGNPTNLTNATPQYTRAGDLSVNSAGYLVTQSGQYVLGYQATATTNNGVTTYSINLANGPNNSINIPPGSTNVAIGTDGSVTYLSAAGATVTAGYISLSSFPNQAGLERDGGSLWSATTASGPEIVGQPNTGDYGQTVSGELEMSNVDLATEFTNMIVAERGYQANSRTITTADQMLQTLVQMGQ
jgi:flagellar hook protein FlgE